MKNKANILEVCAGGIESAMAAAEGGAQRIELCAALEQDGLTPSEEVIMAARKIPGLKLHVLIRPRPGDFVYDERETELMERQIRRAVELGADGVVIGALTRDGHVDMIVCRRLIDAARSFAAESTKTPVSITFHRAFDVAVDPFEALEDIIKLGCTRLLTSGQATSALDGAGLIAALVTHADGRIIIMPGAGVNPGNAADILKLTSCHEIHSSARAGSEYSPSDRAVVASMMQAIEKV